MVHGLPACCARAAASGHATAAPPEQRDEVCVASWVPSSGLGRTLAHTVAQERRCASQQKLRADVADGSGASNWCRSGWV